jgi:hypothetical protein
MSECKFYLFAETPRAGKHHHRFIVPSQCTIPDDISLQTYIDKVRNNKKGNDFVGVSRKVEQVDTNRFGKEILVLAAPNCNISHLANKLAEKLESYKDKLAKIVTEIDWNQTGADNLNVPHKELDYWQNELEQFFRDINKPNHHEKKGNWIMRHKRLPLIIIIILILFVVCRYTVTKLLEDQQQPSSLKNSQSNVPRIELLEKWTGKIQNPTTDKLEQELNKQLEKIPIKYSPENPDVTQKKTATLQQKLQVLSEVLEISVQPKQNLLELDDFLRNVDLHSNFLKLYSKLNNHEPLGYLHDPLSYLSNNQHNEVVFVFFDQQISLEQARKIIDETIKFQVAIATIKTERQADKGSRKQQQKPYEWMNMADGQIISQEDKWISFAKSLTFDQRDKERWEIVKKYNPEWFTLIDVELSKKFFKWLTNDDAKTVLPKNLVNNYAEALQRFANAEVKIETEREINRNEDKIFENETHKRIKRTSVVEIDKNKEALKDELEKLQKSF